MAEIGVGMLGYAFMGKAHSNAFKKIAYMTWPPPLVPRLSSQGPAASSRASVAPALFSVPVSRILPNIITKMNLPATSPDGQPMSYSLDHKEGGRRLLESHTLLEAGVQNGDHLIVYPEVVAGRSRALAAV